MSGRAGRVALTAAFLGLAAGGLAACDDNDQATERDFYCVDEHNVVVDEDRCDDNGGHGYYFMHVQPGTSYAPGARIPDTSGTRFPAADRAARAAHGLPETGRVSNGTKVGIVGKGGGAPAGKGGGGAGG